LVLTENGELTPIVRHSNFRLFAAMNPATDVGKRDLPPMLRTRFTEIYVQELSDDNDLEVVVQSYLSGVEKPPISEIVSFYNRAKILSSSKLFDGAGKSPKYSLRTLCRALEATRIFHDRKYKLTRSLREGFSMSFLTQLEPSSCTMLSNVLLDYFVSKREKRGGKDIKSAPGRPKGSADDCELYVI
jgi:midasin